MEVSIVWCGVGIILAWCALWFMNWVWFKPKRIEKLLRNQGLKGSSYKFLFGDLKESAKMLMQAKSKPTNLNHDIVSRVLPFDQKSVATYGKNYFTWMGPKPMLHVTEPAMAKEVFAKYDQFQKRRGGDPLIKLLETGLVDANSDQWRKHRKIINPAFHVEKLKHMVPAFYTCSVEMINKWEDMLRKESPCEFDIWPDLKALSIEVISRTAFGTCLEEGKRITELQREQGKLLMETFQSIYIPGSSFIPTRKRNKMKEIDYELNVSIRNMINKRIVAIEEGANNNEDLLSILLDSNNKTIKQGDNSSGLSIEEIIEECKIFYFAGQESTSGTLVWTMVLLAHHTNWQDKARDEISQVFGDRKPDIDGLNQLKIVTMVVNEVLRLYPPGVSLPRMIHQETKLGDITLPAGSFTQLEILLLHHDKDLWGEDASEFKPERFSEGVLKATKGQASYFPFGGGPRICIGQNFALLEVKLVLVMILQHFRFDLSPSYSHAPHTIITLEPQFGAHVILHKL